MRKPPLNGFEISGTFSSVEVTKPNLGSMIWQS